MMFTRLYWRTGKEVNCYWSVVMSGRDQVGNRIGIDDGSKKQEARSKKQEATFNSHLSLGRPGDRH